MPTMVHPLDIRPLHSELMASTSLTQHKSKGLSMVIAVVAMVVIPWAAPLIAGPLLASFGIAAGVGSFALTAGSALVGAGLGAGFAAIQGGNILLGAAGGAFSGGVAGFNYSPTSAASGVGGGFSPDAAAGEFANASIGASSAPIDAAGSAGLLSAGDAGGAFSNVGYSDFASPAADVGTASQGFGPAAGAQSFDVLGPDAGGFNEAGQGFNAPGGGGGGPDLSVGSPETPAFDVLGPDTSAVASTATPSSTSGFSDFIDDVLPKGRLGKAAQQGAGKLATRALSSAFVGDTPDMSDEEREMLRRRQVAMDEQRRLLGIQEQRSAGLLRQADNINPEYYGQQRLTEEQNRLKRAQQAGLRKVSPSDTGSAASIRRRNALDTSRLGAYARGANEAQNRRLQLTQAAINTNPTGDNLATSALASQKEADLRYRRLAGERTNAASAIGPIVRAGLGYETEEQKKKKRLGAIS